MATKYYIEDTNGTILSEARMRTYTVLEEKELYDYLQTAEGRKKHSFVYEENVDTIVIEELSNTTKGETKEKRNVSYHKQVKAEKKPNVISFDELLEIENGDRILLHVFILDELENSEEKAILRVRLDELRAVRRCCLTDKENAGLDLVFTDTEVRTTEMVAKMLGVKQQSLDERLKRIFSYLYIELKRRRRKNIFKKFPVKIEIISI